MFKSRCLRRGLDDREGMDLEIGYRWFGRHNRAFSVHASQIVDRFASGVSTLPKFSDRAF
jgi:hypothetical protein